MKMTPHAYLTVPFLGNGGMVFDIGAPEGWADLRDEVQTHIDEMDDLDGSETDDGKPWVVIKIKPEPEGFADSLPEHEGW